MNHIIKNVLIRVSIFRDFVAFRKIYYECTSLWKFLRYRWMRSFKKNIYWPYCKSTEIRGRVVVGKGARVGHRPNCIIQGRGKVFVGDYVEIGPNSVIISGNHSLTNQADVVRKETIIGDFCWIASSCNILAGVVLGPRTVVGAGSVVTKSFPEGYCVIAGNPAKVVKTFKKEDFEQERPKVEYYGYIREDKFETYARKNLSNIKFEYDLSKITDNQQMINLFKKTR